MRGMKEGEEEAQAKCLLGAGSCPERGGAQGDCAMLREQFPLREKETATNFEAKTQPTLKKRPSINIDFSDLHYSVPQHRTSGSKGKMEILQGVSGSFNSGELTAIMGPSGAGKSTLLDILAGYVTVGVLGSIKINGHPRQMKIFNKLSSYIMQDDLMQWHLTVQESMLIAADLKLGKEISGEQKSQIVDEILEMLGLKKCGNTRCEKLSGGQRRRLSVALELVNNPPVVFLDEPTTGLDVTSINRMVKLLRRLARQGRTIICTIHQPSASIFEMFDKLYVISRGKCVYQGSHDQLVPFLSSAGFECPLTYNPADFVIEIVQEKSDGNMSILTKEIQNGKMSMTSENKDERTQQEDNLALSGCYRGEGSKNLAEDFSTTFVEQCTILLKRKMKQQLRNTTTLWIMLIHHVASGSFLGSIFLGVGNDANRPFDNFKFVISVVVFFMYTHVMCPVLLFPTEVRILRREYFNRWYSLKSYFAALSISTIPSQIILGFVVTGICYILSGQPPDISRYLLFATIGLLLGFISEGWGLAIGSLFSEMNGSIVGPASVVPLLAVSVYGMGFGTTVEPFMKSLMSMSYLRYGIVGFSTTLYGYNRSNLNCDYMRNDYCHYKDPRVLLKDLGMEGLSLKSQILVLCVFLIFHRVLAFFCLRYKLSSEFPYRILHFTNKILRRK